MSERFIDVIDVVDNCVYGALGGVFTFDDFNLPLAPICEVFNEFSLCVEGVPDRSDGVWFVVFRFMLWLEDVVGYRFRVFRVI